MPLDERLADNVPGLASRASKIATFAPASCDGMEGPYLLEMLILPNRERIAVYEHCASKCGLVNVPLLLLYTALSQCEARRGERGKVDSIEPPVLTDGKVLKHLNNNESNQAIYWARDESPVPSR